MPTPTRQPTQACLGDLDPARPDRELQDLYACLSPDTVSYDGCEYLPLVQSNANPQEFFIWRSAKVLRGYHEWRGRNEVLEGMFAEAFKAR